MRGGSRSRFPKNKRGEGKKSPSRTASISGKNTRPHSTPAPGKSFFHLPKGIRLVMGLHSVREALRVRPREIETMWLRSNYEDSTDLSELFKEAKSAHISVELKPPQFLDKWISGHQGVGVLLRGRPELDWEKLKAKKKSQLLILDGLQDPHNLGAILRTSWLLRVDGIFIASERAVGLTPTACKVACGGAEHVPVVEETNLASTLSHLKEWGYWIYGLSGEATQNLWQLKMAEKVAWVIGSEEKGIRKPVSRECDELISIPQAQSTASYNASVAAAIALAETARQLQEI